jgi:KUP system potassium uptake protein
MNGDAKGAVARRPTDAAEAKSADPTFVPAADAKSALGAPGLRSRGFWALTLGSVGVVFGDIGTSPLYAFREALAHTRHGVGAHTAILGVVSLVIWALILIVTLKYIIVLMRANNRGEGGTLALMALAQRALGRRSTRVFLLGMIGASLFYAESLLTPAISVLSAVEGVKGAPEIGHSLRPYVIPMAAGILIALFLLQARGTHRMAAFFGPITVLWFLAIGALGAGHLADDIGVFRGLNPMYGARFLIGNGFAGFIILGSVFLAVTGAEALYTDMGHFGKGPIRAAWAMLVFPCLALNYLGQGALVLHNAHARGNPFWALAPVWAYWPLVVLATVATVIASQAMITGAFSMTQQAVQLGLLPRLNIRRTSETYAGQIFAPTINTLLMVGVLLLLLIFQTSSHLASAYGAAVTGAMFIDTLIAYVIVRRLWKWRLSATLALIVPLGLVDLTFFTSNLMKIPDGAWLPLLIAGGLVLVMWTWTRGVQILTDKTRRDSLPLAELVDMLHARPPYRTQGTAVFLTSDPEVTPVALMHNLKHNKCLHQHNVVLTVRTTETPRVADADRLNFQPVNEDFKKLEIAYGFMETPNLPKALQLCKKHGLKFDMMTTSFFLGRRSLVPAAQGVMPMWQDKLFIFLTKNAANPTDFFKIPPGRVVELGAQVTV